MLGKAPTSAAVVALIEGARALRGRELVSDQRQTRNGIHEALIEVATGAVVPTLLLALDGAGNGFSTHQADTLTLLGRIAPARIAPAVQRFVAEGVRRECVLIALGAIGDRETLRALCADPLPGVQREAAAALRALGEEPPLSPPPVPPGELLAHPRRDVREHARRVIEREQDLALMTSYVAALALDGAIGRRYGGAVGSYGELLRTLPDAVRFADHREQLRALRAGEVPGLPPQVTLPSVRAIVDGEADVDALAATYPWIAPLRWSEAEAATLIAEEAAILDGLRAA